MEKAANNFSRCNNCENILRVVTIVATLENATVCVLSEPSAMFINFWREASCSSTTFALFSIVDSFNSLNRMSALHNVRHLCPSIATILNNYYRASTDLVVEDNVILSQEGTTQGDPFGTPMYALATVPLIKRLTSTVKQTWYADDAAATGKITQLRVW